MLSGYIPAAVTPFKNGKVDFDALGSYIEWLENQGISTIVLCGSTGESLSLTLEEQTEILKFASGIIKGNLIGGVICSTTDNCLQIIKNTEEYVSGFLCICPFYVKPTQTQIVAHFKKLSSSTKKPIVVYNNPSRVGVSIEKNAFDQLIDIENVVAVKECSPDLSRFTLWRPLKTFSMLTGNDDSAFGALAMGADGVISVSANVYPKLCIRGYEAFKNHEDFSKYRNLLAPVHELMFKEPSPAPAKYALSKMGLMANELRSPLGPISADLAKKIDNYMERMSDVKV